MGNRREIDMRMRPYVDTLAGGEKRRSHLIDEYDWKIVAHGRYRGLLNGITFEPTTPG